MFTIACPSFIYADTRAENARRLNGLVDEIELLYMSSAFEGDEPDPAEMKELAAVPLRYHAHMPYDVDLTRPEGWRVMELFAAGLRPLRIRSHTLHAAAGEGFIRGLAGFCDMVGNKVSVENTNGDIALFDSLVDTPATFCIDVGHALLDGVDPVQFLKRFEQKVSHMHLHAVHNGKDHTSLRNMDSGMLHDLLSFAAEKSLVVSIEMFREKEFFESLPLVVEFRETYRNPHYRRGEER